ncbi:MAG: ATP-binding cassette domain-containing protein, partial [Acidimicrobiaceae bacterium]|nr:ATP-binding cassette domain-containing protein [Acidimicrobiaceae bacterium]
MTGESTRSSVEARGVSKAFGGVAALDAVDFEVRWSEVHALVGENGAGKTTLCNILAGIYRADAGQVIVDGAERDFRSPAHAGAGGLGVVPPDVGRGGPGAGSPRSRCGSTTC